MPSLTKITATAFFATAVSLVALASAQGQEISGTTLVVYTPNEEGMLQSLIPVFEGNTGVTVQLITAGTGELYSRIRSESGNPQGDVMFGGGAAQAAVNSELWQEYVSPEDANMVDAGKNTTGAFTPYQADGSNLLVNTEGLAAAGIEVNSYADLLQPELKGKIAYGDPTGSSSAFAQLTNMLKAVGGDYEAQAGWDYVTALVDQLDGISIGSSSQVAADVANGEYIVGLTYEPLSLNFVLSGAPVEIVYPSEGAAFLPATIQMIKGGPNPPAAEAFIDFIISEEGQTIIAEQTAGRPLRDGIDKPGLPALADIPTVQEDGPYVAAHREEIVAKYRAILEARS
ncbi:MAG: extracellular solute-binding protein [Devosia sp.]|jgi:iron(III) transport system substrate-binding protein|uniref:extracellular solute-binding protein n=1 Tax=unclassified Devosia TaxID=196773 RepID=UPI0019E45561|nr:MULTISPECIES: extracellular solute-binding protein [unclassified Devosia]MBF0678676.1 extracellular solute-binding protein [Devosia sp.]WEJ31753.1 extracellular solute-binding protein [Devosia sp. SD17-2]